jgi:hypothetical protein
MLLVSNFLGVKVVPPSLLISNGSNHGTIGKNMVDDVLMDGGLGVNAIIDGIR